MSIRMSGPDRSSNAYGILKLSELTFLLVSMGIFKGADLIFSASHPVAIDTFFSGMFVMGIVITAILFICHLVGQTTYLQQTFLEPLINITMFIGLAAVGGIIIGCLSSDDGYVLENKVAEAYAMTATTWISSAIYLVDFIYSVIVYKK
ncbi:uncharacterized protein LOC135214585 [Macrobrachium nipponense]|uniref:uncharacterized protein LOC135214585 n=1 Tax=Macrobrachium nipponense TaxID=159736 RepID=UPI0030C7CF26